MNATERHVAAVMARFGRQLPVERITGATAMAQDAYIDGIDVDDFVWALEERFGGIVREIPWLTFSDQRASFRSCGCLLLPFWLLARPLAMLRGETFLARPGSIPIPRLTVGHIAKVIDQGYWVEPDDMTTYYRAPLSA